MPGLIQIVLYLLLASLAAVVVRREKARRALGAIPAVGSTNPIFSNFTAVKGLFNYNVLIQEGYEKYKGRTFRIPELNGWRVIATSSKLVDDVRKAPDDVLSFMEATSEAIQIPYTLGRNVHENPYHVPIVGSQLTRNISSIFPVIRDEIACAFQDLIPAQGAGWVAVPAMDTLMKVICRISNRVFVGLPKCRDPDYMELNVRFTIDVVVGAQTINLFPTFLKPLAGMLLTNVNKSLRRGVRHLRPIIEERQRQYDEYGTNYPGKPNDMLSWLMDEAQGEERTIENLTRRIMTINFAAIHTSSMSFTQALYNLAANPEYIAPLREEVDAVVASEGWSKAAMQKMRKVDSFIRESQRFEGLGLVSMGRLALKDFTLSDGTFIPAGTNVSVAARPMHHDEEYYLHADTFEPFRFSEMRDEDGEGTKHQLVATSSDFLAFGHGRHACPGRFFAANELKAMLGHIVSSYDVMMEDGIRPPSSYFGAACVPDTKAKVLFRKRQF